VDVQPLSPTGHDLMKWPSFDYLKASSVRDAVAALHEHGGEARLLGGGQSLMPMLALRLAPPSILVDINDIPSLKGIRVCAGNVALGAATRYSSVERSAEVKTHCPFLADVVRYIGDRQIRSRGTVGGALAQADTNGELVLPTIALGATVLVEGPIAKEWGGADVAGFVGFFVAAVAYYLWARSGVTETAVQSVEDKGLAATVIPSQDSRA
jgi:carbon-monoxide dehydrogenase medium subunit